ncbi:MAG: CDP-alcohol phosphatidyltransferase family protein [Polyangiaceae bacterium]
MGFISAYKASLKPSDVEEPIDRWFHRPLGHVIAYSSNPFSFISPNLLTMLSIVFGWLAAIAIVWPFPYHMQVGALLLLVSVALDCADGQLARMRKSSSAFGRMLDGIADLLVIVAVAPATGWAAIQQTIAAQQPTWVVVLVGVLAAVTGVTSSFHTGMYDHYKNVVLRFTSPTFKEGEDYETARKRWEESKDHAPWWQLIAWRIYLYYVKSQEDVVRGFDPYGVVAIGDLPAYDPRIEAIFRKHGMKPFIWLRGWFGFGSLVFGLQVVNFFECVVLLIAFRLVLMNAVFYLYVRPLQRKASQKIFAELEAEGLFKRPVPLAASGEPVTAS